MRPLDPLTLPLSGALLIEASAGTGKTYTITSIVLRLIVERNLRIDEILVVTYTRAATAELKTRIRARIASALSLFRGEPSEDPLLSELCARSAQRGERERDATRLEQALASLDDAPIFTIHAFCQRALTDNAFESGVRFDAQLTTDNGELLGEISDDYYQEQLNGASDAFLDAVEEESPEKLRKIAARAAGSDLLRVLPQEPAVLDALGREALEAQRLSLRRIWSEDQKRIVALVGALPRNGTYIEKWSTEMDALLEGDEVGFSTPRRPSFEAFTTRGIAKKAKGKIPLHPFFDEAERFLVLDEQFMAARKASLVGFRRGFVDYARSELEERMEAQGSRSFDALLSTLARALEADTAGALHDHLRARYKVALVDEFQDTDPIQYRIFASLFATGDSQNALFMIGDPKQAIYAFRGADVFAYLEAKTRAGENVYTLDKNRRSDEPFVSALNHFYGRIRDPFLTRGIDYLPVSAAKPSRLRSQGEQAPLDLKLVADSTRDFTQEVAERIASDIVRLLERGETRTDDDDPERTTIRRLLPRDVAVLCRRNDEARLIQEKLSALNVPSVMSGDSSVLDSDDALEIERAMLALAHPGDARALRSLLGSHFAGFDAHEIMALDTDDERWDAHRAFIHDLHATWQQHGFTQAMRALTRHYEVEAKLLRRPDGMRRITNMWHLVELVSEAQVTHRLGPLGALRWLRSARDDQKARLTLVNDGHELRLESSEDAVLLTTIHKSKGLEYPIVYVPFVFDGNLLRGDDSQLVRFHDPEHNFAPSLDLGSDDHEAHKELAKGEALAESLRLLYVALTRAKHRAVVVVAPPKQNKFHSSALAYSLFGGRDPEAVSKRVADFEIDALARELFAIAVQSHGLISFERLPQGDDRPYHPFHAEPKVLEARRAKRVLDITLRTASFSSLVLRAPSHKAEVGIDRDEMAADDDAQDQSSTLILDPFPRGAVAGELVHEVLELFDLTGTREALHALCEEKIVARGYDPTLVDMLTEGLTRALDTELAPRLKLNRIAPAQRLNEMEFIFPVTRELTPRALAQCLKAHGACSASPSYPSEVANLGFDGLRGFLRGFIDLIFEFEGRFYVVDYKSNRLGPRASDYTSEKLAAAMAAHHYYLQYHLYTLALHRYLRTRIFDYSYERHIGGVFYLFLRGMSEEHERGAGVFEDRPSEALIHALDALLTSDEKEGRA